jgi:chromosomal replication initiator protein
LAPLQHTEIEQFVTRLQTVVGAERWQVWFAGATAFHLADEGLTVGVANLFLSDYLKTRFADRLAQAACETFGRPMPITFRVQPDLFQKRRSENMKGEIEAMEKLGQADPQPAAPPPAAHAPATNYAPTVLQTRAATPASAPMRPLFTLDSFVVGPCNAMAYAAAQSAAVNPGKDFHPLFIHGSCGLGKTHLLQGILYALRKRGDLRVVCLSAEQFTNRYLSGMRTGGLDAFRHRYRNLDVLAIDDVHFLANKTATQEEFLHTFNEFEGGRRLIILASDSHPREIEAIQDHLISRWMSGLVVRLSAPDEETRHRILHAKARLMGHAIPDDVATLIAARVQGSVRELEGALARIIAFASLLKLPITTDLARQSLADFVPTTPPKANMEAIEETVSSFFGVTRGDVHSHRKSHPVSLARQVTMVMARDMTQMSFAEIARALGGKNHTTVLAACRKWQELLKTSAEVRWSDRTGNRSMPAEALLAYLKDRVRR